MMRDQIHIIIGSIIGFFIGAVCCISNPKALKARDITIRPIFILDSSSTDTLIERDTVDLYSQAIDYLKEVEGFRSEIYYDTDGSPTIGYGHHLLPGEKYTRINKEEATKLLKRDLSKRIEFVNSITKVDSIKSLSLGLLAYNLGNAGLSRAIDNGLLNNPSNMLKYCKYLTTIDGEKVLVESSLLKERRKFELYLYQYEF